MKFTPKYTVSYRGAFHPAGKPFDIAAEDAEEMRKHGTVEAADEPEQPPAPEQPEDDSEQPALEQTESDEPKQPAAKKPSKAKKTE